MKRIAQAQIGGLTLLAGLVGLWLLLRTDKQVTSNQGAVSSRTGDGLRAPSSSGKPGERSSLIPFQRGELQGYKDGRGQVVIQPQFVRAEEFSNGRAVVWLATDHGVRAGYIDTRGKWIVEPIYTRAESFGSSGVTQAEIDGLWGYVDPKGNWVIEPQFQSARSFEEGLAAIAWYRYPPPLDGARRYAWTYLTPQGKLLVPEITGAVWAGDFSHGLAPFRCEDDRYGTINLTGSVDRACMFATVCRFDGKALLWFTDKVDSADTGYCFAPRHTAPWFDARGPIAPSYSYVAIAELEDTQYAFAKLTPGKDAELLSEAFQAYSIFPELDGEATGGVVIAKAEKAGWTVYDSAGRRLVPWQRERIVAYNDGILIYEVGDPSVGGPSGDPDAQMAARCAKRYGARDRSGHELLRPRFPLLEAFSEGLAGACEASRSGVGGPSNGCGLHLQWCGYIDRAGEHVVDLSPAIFAPPVTSEHDCSRFTFQLLNDARRRSANATLEGTLMGLFRRGVASMVGLNKDGRKSVGLVDKKGNWVVRPRFASMGTFSRVPGGAWRAPAQLPRRVDWLDKNGRLTKSPL